MMHIENRSNWIFFLVVTTLATVVAVMYPMVANDSINRYAPMAEAFAEGNWQESFHPRFGVLFQVLAGIVVWLTGIRGNVACSVVGVLGWAFCMIPLYLVVKHVFDDRVARIAVILYVIAPMPFEWALRGTRESYRLLGSLLMMLGIMRTFVKANGSLMVAGIGATILASIRGDTAVVAVVLTLVYAVGDRFRGKTWALVGWLLLALQPSCLMVWKWTGWWVPASQYIRILPRIMEMIK